jgi:hypothetical protein
VVIGTVEYDVYTYFSELGIPIKFLWHEIPHDADTKLYGEALEMAESLVLKVGADPEALFHQINLLDVLTYDLTMQFLSILRIKYSFDSRAHSAGALLLIVGFPISHWKPSVVLPFSSLEDIRDKYGRRGLRLLLRKSIRPYRRYPSPLAVTALKDLANQIPRETSGKRRVLCVVNTSPRQDQLEPFVCVLNEIRKNTDLEALILADNSYTRNYLSERRIDCLMFTQFVDSEIAGHWRKVRRIYEAGVLRLIDEYGSATIRALMLSSFAEWFLNMSAFIEIYSRICWLERIFAEFKSDAAVVAFTYSYLGRIASRLASGAKVPTITFFPTMPIRTAHPEFRLYDATDYIAGFGEHFKNTLAASGVDPKKVIVVGNPGFDEIVHRKASEDRKEVLNRLFGVDRIDYLFLVASYLFAPGTREWLPALLRQLNRLDSKSFKLVIKLHPADESKDYVRILEEEGFKGAGITKDLSLYSLLNASDILFTGMSTVGSEAVMFNKPMICINLTNVPYPIRYDEEGVALLVKKEDDILPTIEAILHDEKTKQSLQIARERFQNAYTGQIDGRASERFVEAIKHIMSVNTR